MCQRYLAKGRGDYCPKCNDTHETIEQFFDRVSMGDNIYRTVLLEPLNFLPNSPTLFNLGLPTGGTLSACFKFDVDDSLLDGPNSIMAVATKAAGVTKFGGGVGYYFGNIRPRGSLVNSTHGKAMGPVEVLRHYQSVGRLITQAGKREAAQMGILDAGHPDIREFIHTKDSDPQSLNTFNISVAASDEFMRRAINDNMSDEHALLWEMAESAWKTGDPGLYFKDTAEKTNPTPWLGKLTGTNPCGEVPLLNNEPCLTGDSLVDLGDGGLRRLIDLRNAEGFSLKTVTERGTPVTVDNCYVVDRGVKPVFDVFLANGQRLRATDNHRFYTDSGWKAVGELASSDKVRIPDTALSTVDKGDYLLDEMFGWMVGDGWFIEGSAGILFGPDDGEAFDKLKPVWDAFVEREYAVSTQPSGVRQITVNKTAIIEKFRTFGFEFAKATEKKLPSYIFTATAGQQAAFVRGLMGADGTVSKSGSGTANRLVLASSAPQLVEEFQIVLSHLGIQSWVQWWEGEGRNPQAQVNISGKSAQTYMDVVGFTLGRKNDRFEWLSKHITNNREFMKVKVVEPAGEEPVFDIVMPDVHSFYANGMLVHNCNLGSINLGNFIRDGAVDYRQLGPVVRLATRYLDDIVSLNSFPDKAILAANLETRKLGLGVCGWADMLALLGLDYDSDDAVHLANEVMEFINDQARESSIELAGERGPAPCFTSSGHNFRNATRTCIAPTGSIAILMDASSGIEPYFAEEWKRTLGTGEVLSEGIKPGINGHTPHISHDIAPEWHIRHQAAFQSHTDLAVSKTINLSNSATVSDIYEAYVMMWQTGCKGGTVFRDGSRSEQVLNVTTQPAVLEKCESCGAGVVHAEGCIECEERCGWSACAT